MMKRSLFLFRRQKSVNFQERRENPEQFMAIILQCVACSGFSCLFFTPREIVTAEL